MRCPAVEPWEPAYHRPRLMIPTRREREVLAHVAKGKTNPEIGRMLFISEWTVRSHLQHLFAKIGVRNRVEATLWYWRQENGG